MSPVEVRGRASAAHWLTTTAQSHRLAAMRHAEHGHVWARGHASAVADVLALTARVAPSALASGRGPDWRDVDLRADAGAAHAAGLEFVRARAERLAASTREVERAAATELRAALATVNAVLGALEARSGAVLATAHPGAAKAGEVAA